MGCSQWFKHRRCQLNSKGDIKEEEDDRREDNEENNRNNVEYTDKAISKY